MYINCLSAEIEDKMHVSPGHFHRVQMCAHVGSPGRIFFEFIFIAFIFTGFSPNKLASPNTIWIYKNQKINPSISL